MRLGEPDVAKSGGHAFDGDPPLVAHERRARAGVDAATERQVLAGVGPVDAEILWALETATIPVGGRQEHHQAAAGGDLDADERGRLARRAEVGLHRALEAEHLLDEVGDPPGLVPKAVLELRLLGEQL